MHTHLAGKVGPVELMENFWLGCRWEATIGSMGGHVGKPNPFHVNTVQHDPPWTGFLEEKGLFQVRITSSIHSGRLV